MGDQVENKFCWVIKKVSTLESEKILSDPFVIGGCRWRVVAFFKGSKSDECLSLSLEVADAEYLPSGWTRHAEFSFTIIHQGHSEEFSSTLLQDICRAFTERREWFDHKTPACASRFPLGKLDAKYGGFQVDGQVKIVAEVKVLKAIGQSDVSAPKKTKRDTWINVYGFPVLPTEVEFVRSVFENHPDVASEFCHTDLDPCMKRGYMYYLIGVIENLSKPPQEISTSCLVEARKTLLLITQSGLKVDWVEKMLNEVTEHKGTEEEGPAETSSQPE